MVAGPTDGAGNNEPDMKTVTVETTYRVRYDSITENPIVGDASLLTVSQTFLADD